MIIVNKISKKIVNHKTVFQVLSLIFVFLSIAILFPAGLFNSSSKVEHTADYLASVAKNHTITSQYIGMLVQPKDTTDKKINNSVDEFRYLYGKFKETKATYISTVNAEKNHSVFLKSIDDGKNYSFLNNDNGFGTPEYHGHFKTEVYPLELMFYGKHLSPNEREKLPDPSLKYTSFIYISQSNADKLLDKKGQEHTPENYNNLLGDYVHLSIDGSDYYYWIEDIYLEINYFYEAVSEVVGDFFMCGGSYPPSMKKQALFFLRDYAFQNKYYIDYSTSSYSTNDFDYQFLTLNINDGFVIDSKNIYINSNNNNAFSTTFVLFSIFFVLLGIFLAYFAYSIFTWRNHIFYATALLVPYILFWIIHIISHNGLLFSGYSTSWAMGIIIAFVSIYLVMHIFKVQKGNMKKHE